MSDPIYDRRSIRKYSNKDISKEIIEQIINAGRMAPSAKNRQPWKYIVFKGNQKADFLEFMRRGIAREENGTCSLPKSREGIPDAKDTLKTMIQAPVLIVVLNTNGTSPFDNIDVDERVTEICDSLSIGASIQNMLLKATELGVGTLWIANTCFAYKELTNYLGTTNQLIGAVAVGYANEEPAMRPRKKFKDIVEYRM